MRFSAVPSGGPSCPPQMVAEERVVGRGRQGSELAAENMAVVH